MTTVLITGCSSGFGLDIAHHFLDRGWTVVATMRHLRGEVLPPSDRLRLLALDVTEADSIRAAIAAAGPVDVLVNNAGIGWLAPLEGTPIAAARELFATNTLGAIAVTQAVVPQMRERQAGVIVNVSSSVTFRPLPLLSVYTASKAALNAFSECLALELEPFGVRVKLVLPGRAPRHALRRQRPGQDGERRARWLWRVGPARHGGDAGGRPRHPLVRRGGGGVARGHRSRLPDAASGGGRCGRRG